MSDLFPNARDFSIGDHATFNTVQGDQHQYNAHYHGTTMTVAKKKPLWMQLLGKKDSEYDQYEEVKRGDVELIREIVRGLDRIRGPKMTIVSYEGPEAQKEWKRDFRQFSSTLRVGNAHLLAINQSKIPLLIFTSELIPAAQFVENVGLLVQQYLSVLMALRLGGSWNELWIDPQRGVLCRGPEGPEARSRALSFIKLEESVDAPSSVELLRDDICIRYLVGLESKVVDHSVTLGLSFACSDCFVIEVVDKSLPHNCFWEPTVDHFKVIQPKVVSALTNTPVAVGTRTLDWDNLSVLSERVLLANGMTRFTLAHSSEPYLFIGFDPYRCHNDWLSNASSVFHARGISLEDDLSEYKLIGLELILRGVFEKSKPKRRRRHQQPIFLFIHPPLSTPIETRGTITSLHYWSFNEDGRDPLSAKMCRRLGLPVALTVFRAGYRICSWPSEVYKTIHDYQIAGGFDPTTPDFSRYLVYPTYTAISADSSRFEETNVTEEVETLHTLYRKDKMRRGWTEEQITSEDIFRRSSS